MIRPFLLTAVIVTALAAGAAASPVRVDRADDGGVTFVYTPGPYKIPASQLLPEGKATCTGISFTLVALLRAAGIPAR